MVSDPEVRRFLPPAPFPTLETFQSAIERRHALERERGYSMWAVDVMATGTFVGQCGLHFNKAAWSKGYATEAAIAVLAHGLGPAGLDHVIALVVPENVGSARVAEKAGMRLQGTTDAYYDMPGLKLYVAEREWWRPPLRG